ncbi:hypothetical protein SAMN05216389_10128 [Oceanobacillus limi]|uniref:ABC-2 family transporter protein n=1 Tax=Oceanobacillus limi TaxID=930131 RepID=A0A1H9XZ74_9BACI|nr:hypothetical protein [Oceanobacillus limi]SES61741.1 hypothetical protein SAMN05216389_10128 [Oceanobacillus limi]
MNRAMFVHEFKMMSKSRKNVLFIIALISLILSYCFLVLPSKETSDSFQPEEMKKEISNLEAVQQGMINRGGTGFVQMAGRGPYAESVYEQKIKSRLVTAFEDGDMSRFVQLRMKGNVFNEMQQSRDWMLISGAPFPAHDQSRNISLRNLRYQGYLDADVPITYEMIEQKTALQTIQNFLIGTTAFMVLFCAIYFSSDMISKDRQHRSVLQGAPIGWYRVINIKSFVAFMYTLLVLIGIFVLALAIISIQNGLGSFKLSIPITIPSTEPDDYFGYRFSEYETITMLKFFLLVLGIIPILVYLFIRLNAILSLLFKNSWLVLMISSAILFSERIYYSRTLTELFGFEISNFPQTYFDFGRIISGEKYYLVHLESISYQQGILVLLITVFILEIILLIVSRIMNKRRFYQGA